jgi:hypothetical protein
MISWELRKPGRCSCEPSPGVAMGRLLRVKKGD